LGDSLVDSRLPKLVFVMLAVVAAVYFSSLYGQLPEMVATHFSGNGTPGNWQPKSVLMWTLVAVTVIPAAFVFGVPAILRVLPAATVNLPNKQYWLSGDRAAETQEFLTGWFGWFGCAVFSLTLWVFNFVMQWNLHPGERRNADNIMWGVGALAAFTAAWVLRLMVHFAGQRSSSSL
jgi:uncharacterized membrane protein